MSVRFLTAGQDEKCGHQPAQLASGAAELLTRRSRNRGMTQMGMNVLWAHHMGTTESLRTSENTEPLGNPPWISSFPVFSVASVVLSV